MKQPLCVCLALLMAAFISLSCSKTPTEATISDEDQIKDLLLSSQYTDTTTFVNDGTSIPLSVTSLKSADKNEIFPDSIKFARKVDQVVRTVSVTLDPDSINATATITLDIYGIMYVDNDGDSIRDPFQRNFNSAGLHDRATRYARLRKINDVWHVWGVTPLELYTLNGDPGLGIDSVVISGCANSNGIVVIKPLDMVQTRLRNLLPVFNPGDSVTVSVWASPSGQFWSFLHRWLYRVHDRRPLEKVDGQMFTYSWQVPVDALLGVRHASVDVISQNCLFGDNTATYSAKAWCLPYIVAADTVNLP
ncbi:hypothetical protein HZA73_01930 [candidate division TA06 bacterium]|nr:hypothetical protein [candidate division TA06 bacterium]